MISRLIRAGMLALLLLLGACGAVPAAAPSATPEPAARRAEAPTKEPLTSAPGAGAALAMVVYKSPTCGCCAKWNEHLEAHGFAITVEHVTDLAAVKDRHGVPAAARSCHTALVDGYVIEGHVPAAEIKRLLAERPNVAGLAVGGMPPGSPGMEGGTTQPYDVLSFDASGATSVFAQYGR